MKRLIPTLAVVFLCLKITAQVPTPQVPLTGTPGPGGPFVFLNAGGFAIPTDANYTLSYPNYTCINCTITSSVPLTTTRNVVWPAGGWDIDACNYTTGGQSVQIIGPTGTGATIPNGQCTKAKFDGTNWVLSGGSGGGGIPYPGAGIGNSTGSAWATSYNSGNQIPANFISTLNQNTTGNAATATALAATPTPCTLPQFSYGISTSGAAICATPTGSGIPTTPSNALVKINGAAGAASSITDNGTTVATTEPFSANGITATATAGTAGIAALVGGATVPSIPANQFGWLGFNTGSATAYFLQPNTTAPTGNQVMGVGATSGGVSQVSYIPNFTTVNATPCALGGTCTLPLFCAGFACPNYNQNNPNFPNAVLALSSSVTSTSLSIPVASTAGWPSIGCGWMATPVEYFCWDSTTSSTFVINSTSERGLNGTTAASHTSSTALAGAAYTQASSPTNAQSIAISSDGQVGFGSAINPALTYINGFNGNSAFLSGVQVFGQIQPTGGFQFVGGVSNYINGVSSNVNGNEFVTCPTGGTGTQVCDAAGAWISSGGGGTPTVTTLSGTTPAITLSAASSLYTITLSGNTTPTISGITAGYSTKFQICQPATGGPYSWTWPASMHGGITIGTTASACSQQSFDSYSGTTLVAQSTGVINVLP